MRIYTKTGDSGETSLYGGERVGKDDARVWAYGTTDECNAVLGMAVTWIADDEIRAAVTRIQGELFEVGADLATPLTRGASVPRLTTTHAERLEVEIDRWEGELVPLGHFILPGGSTGGALLHQARAVLRRAERHVVALQREAEINPEIVRYLNRLSDHLFVLARLANHRAGTAETIWERPGQR